jgi:hypothetical protein
VSYVAIIVGISGAERFLALRPGEPETPERKRARRFRSEGSARTSAGEHIGSFAPVVARAMSFRVEPVDAGPRDQG